MKYWNQSGNTISGYCAFYDFLINEVKRIDAPFDVFKSVQEYMHYFFVFEDFVFISEKPIGLHFKGNNLHNEKGMACEYKDGWGLYSLNGIAVPDWLVNTPAEQIDPKRALEEKNADVQREIIRKVGYERMLKACNAQTIDSWKCPKTKLKYELKSMKFGAIDRLYMCFEHASVPGVFYAKPVPPNTRNCVEARAFQVGIITENEIGEHNEEVLLTNLPEVVK